jgi:glycosyltransferase involved in cell wall biosynthesis
LAREAVLDELTCNDFFVLLSDFEGLPLSLGEAMARGCVPVVAESPSGIPELIVTGENGLIVAGRDYDEWARLLVDLWRDRSRYSAMSRSGRKTVRHRFTVEQAGEQLSELFERVAAEIESGGYRRPPALHWGPRMSKAGDVLPPPSMHDPAVLDWV